MRNILLGIAVVYAIAVITGWAQLHSGDTSEEKEPNGKLYTFCDGGVDGLIVLGKWVGGIWGENTDIHTKQKSASLRRHYNSGYILAIASQAVIAGFLLTRQKASA